MTDTREVVYLEHPVTPEEKQKYLRQGKRIIDARFAPAGEKIANKKRPARKASAVVSEETQTSSEGGEE